MIELKLRGYVTPEDFGGDVQTAIDKAEQLDIRKVVLNGDYACGTLILPGYTHLIINGTLKADLHSKKGCGWCDEQDRYFLEGGKLDGSIYLYNTRRAVVQTPGSRIRHRSSSMVVRVICTTALLRLLIRFSRSISRKIRSDFVIMVTPKPYFSISSRDLRVNSSSVSRGI